jgi:PST family polysaccharide transporter
VADVASLAAKTASGAAWTIVTSLGSRVLGLVGTLVLVRFIDPTDYGEVLGASVLAATALVVSNLGLGQYLVAQRDAGRVEAWHVTFYCFVACAGSLGLALVFGERIGEHFQLAATMQYLPALAAVTLVERTASLAERQLYRQLRFKLIAIGNAIAEVLYAVVSLAAVVLDQGGWAIVWGNFARTACRAFVIFAAVDRRDWLSPGPLRWEVTRRIFRFGLPLALSGLAGFASRKWDNMLTARFFGPALMGAYNVAYNLADVPASQVGEQVGDVLLPVFATANRDGRKRGLVRALKLLALIVFPLATGLCAVSASLVAALFDARWETVAPMLALLSALSLARPVSYAVGSYLLAMGRTATASLLEVARLVLLLVSMLVLGRLGPLWLCAAVGWAVTTHAVVCLWVVSLDGIPLGATLRALARPLVACVPMVGAVYGVRYGLSSLGVACPSVSLLLEIVVGALVFACAALIVARPIALELAALVKDMIARRKRQATDQ